MAEETEGSKKNPLPKILAAVGMLLVAGIFLFIQFKPGGFSGGPGEYFYWDEKAGALIVHGPALAPFKVNPTDADATGVLAHVYTCGSCADEGQRFITYLEKFTPEALAKLQAIGVQSYDLLDDDIRQANLTPADVLVRGVQDTDWVSTEDESVLPRLTAILANKCGGSAPKICSGPKD